MELLPEPHAAPTHAPPSLPEPPPPPNRPPTARDGQITTGWRTAFAVTWAGVFFSLAAVWQTSRKLGLPTWWLGPTSDPRLLVVQLLPFLAPTLAVLAATWNLRQLPWIGVGAALATLAVAAGDLGSVTRLAIVEAAVGLAGLATSVAVAGTRDRAPRRLDR